MSSFLLLVENLAKQTIATIKQMEMLQLISPGGPGAAAVMSRETGNCVKLVPRPRQEEELTIRITPRWDAGTRGPQLDNGIATFICEAFCRDVQTM